MPREIKINGDSTLVINMASFEASRLLWAAVQRAMAENGINPNTQKLEDFLSGLIMKVDSAPYFNAALWPCLIRCTLNNRKIEPALFEPEAMRRQYYQVVVPCIEENIGPFVGSLFSELSARLAQLPMLNLSDAPKSE